MIVHLIDCEQSFFVLSGRICLLFDAPLALPLEALT